MKKDWMIAVTGDKGGVGKSTLVALLAEWLLHQGRSVHIIDTDPNQTTQTWVDKWCLYSRREILVGKGFLDVNCPTFDSWTLNLRSSVITI